MAIAILAQATLGPPSFPVFAHRRLADGLVLWHPSFANFLGTELRWEQVGGPVLEPCYVLHPCFAHALTRSKSGTGAQRSRLKPRSKSLP